jgi:hypothetical protein
MRFVRRKRVMIPAIAGVLALVGAGAAYAYFTSTGSGTGSAKVGTAASLTITQVGAGYDSLIPSNSYSQDQCFACTGPQEFGNEVTLSTPTATELTSVIVAIDNWGGLETGVPMTLSIPGAYTPGGAALSDTQDFNFAAAINSDTPSETNITFNFAPQDAFVDATFVYGITFNTAADEPPVTAADSLNVALSSSATDLSVGSDTNPGTIWMDDTNANNNDFPACMDSSLPTTGFEQVTTNCGPYSPSNPGAYGTPAEVAAGSADIPAVQVNVVGGTVPPLYPGGPSEPVDFAITNPGASSVYVTTVHATVSGLTVVGANQNGSLEACSTTFYPIANSPDTVDATVPSGTTIESPSGMTISMTNDGNNQDNCEGATLTLGFTSP